MRVIAESTDQTATINGQKCRVWTGVSEGGKPLYLFVLFMSCDAPDDDPAIAAAHSPLPEGRLTIHIDDILEGG